MSKMTREQFRKNHNTWYNWLLRNNKELLDKYYPIVNFEDPSGKKDLILKIAEEGKEKPKSRAIFGIDLNNYTNKKSLSYDKEFDKKIRQLRPDWFVTPKDKSFKKMMSLMPSNVSFKEEQIWVGVASKYIFIDHEYGPFEATPSSLMSQSWPKRNTGNPARKKAVASKRESVKVKNLDTGEFFDSVKLAAQAVSKNYSGICEAIKHNRTCGGFRWGYAEEND